MHSNLQAPSDQPLLVCFLVRQLNTGGAQRQLIELVRSLDRRRFQPVIVTMYSGGELWRDIIEVPGVRCTTLNKQGRWDVAKFLWRFAREMRRVRPAIVQGCVGVCNMLALAGRAVAPGARVVWSIRCSEPDFISGGWIQRLSFRLERLLSRLPDAIIANSQSGKDYYVGCGFPSTKIAVVRNGIDTRRFRPQPDARARMRAEWGVAPEELVIEMAGRIHPQKGHRLFLQAAARAAERAQRLRYAIVGEGPAGYVDSLQRLARDLGLEDRVIWAGPVHDMAAAYNAADVFTSCSSTEGFPNVLCEAMACGVPCAATPAGDSGFILGSVGVLMNDQSPEGVAQCWLNLLTRSEAERRALGRLARQRIETECSTEGLARKTAEVLEEIS